MHAYLSWLAAPSRLTKVGLWSFWLSALAPRGLGFRVEGLGGV